MLIATTVRRFANDVIAPKVREMDENEMMDPTVIKGLFERGVRSALSIGVAGLIAANSQLMGIEIPSEFGGSESSFTSAILTIEELAKIDPSVSVMCDVHNTLVNTVVRKYGTKEQQEKYLPLLAQSKVGFTCYCGYLDANPVVQLGSFCLSEAASGSDAFALQTRAKKEGNNWIINGSKMWITNSYEADIFLIFANVCVLKHFRVTGSLTVHYL